MSNRVDTKTNSLIIKIFCMLPSVQMWGCKCNGKWVRPISIKHNGEYYLLKDECIDEEFDITHELDNDILKGDYFPTGIKVDENG